MNTSEDKDRIDWLSQDESRLQDVYWRIQNENVTVREAIDWFCAMQKAEMEINKSLKKK